MEIRFSIKDSRWNFLSNFYFCVIEDAPWDSFWESGPDGDGKNMLGRILMEVREELRKSKSTL